MIISDDCKQTQVGGLQSYHFHVHLDGCGAFIRSSAARRAASASSFFRCLSKSLQRKPNFGQVSISIRHTPLHLFSLVRLASAIYDLLHPPGHVRVNPKCSSAKRNRSALPSSHAAQPVVPNDLCFGGFRWSASRKKVKQHLVLPSCRLAVWFVCFRKFAAWVKLARQQGPPLPRWLSTRAPLLTANRVDNLDWRLCLILLNNAKECKRQRVFGQNAF